MTVELCKATGWFSSTHQGDDKMYVGAVASEIGLCYKISGFCKNVPAILMGKYLLIND